jgi:PAT family beta-lactamase induction signal transducer AmpG
MLAVFGGLHLANMLPWNVVFMIMAALVGVGIAAILANPEPDAKITTESRALEVKAEAFMERTRHLPPRLAHTLAWLYAACLCPLLEFRTRKGWLAILLFIMLYKFGDAVLGVMQTPFLLEIGFTKPEIANIVKGYGVAATILGGFVGGIIVARIGIMRGLLLCGVLMGVSNLVFVLLAQSGHDLGMLAIAVSVEAITTGMGMTAFVAYMSSLCNVAYTATQYALLTSLMAVGRTVLSSGSGWLAEQFGWTTFFVITTVAALPGLLILVWLMRQYPRQSMTSAPAPSPAE